MRITVVKCLKLYPDAVVPERATDGAVGYDACAYHVIDRQTRKDAGDLPIEILPGGAVLFGIGVALAVPMPWDCQVRPRSGLANKHDIEVSNSPGTIDPDYRGEASVLLRNRGHRPFTVEKGMRIAQLVFTEVGIPHIELVDTLPPTRRASGGFGSTGLGAISGGDSDYRAAQARLDRYFMGIASSASMLSNCLRGAERDSDGGFKKDCAGLYCGAARRFGCVFVKNGAIVGQGFNSRTDDCDEETGCVRERESIPTGTANDRGCLHAEEAALQNHASVGGPSLRGATLYVNAEPCLKCAKLLGGTGITTVVVPEGIYPKNGLKYLIALNIEVRRVAL